MCYLTWVRPGDAQFNVRRNGATRGMAATPSCTSARTGPRLWLRRRTAAPRRS